MFIRNNVDAQWLSAQLKKFGLVDPALVGTGYEGDILFCNIGGKRYGLKISEIFERIDDGQPNDIGWDMWSAPCGCDDEVGDK